MIGVIGATGFTGQLVAAELKRLQAHFFIAGRREPAIRELAAQLGNVPFKAINVESASTLAELDGCNVIINCAGPFTDLGEAVVQEAIKRRIHYLDLTGEQGFIKLVYDRYHAAAREQGIALVPACAFEYALGDAAGALLLSELPTASSVEFVYAIKGTYTSAGTRKSIVRALASPGYQYIGGQLVECAPAATVKTVQLDGRSFAAMSFPAGEILMLPKHTEVQNIQAFMLSDLPALALTVMGKVGQPVMRQASNLLFKAAASGAVPTVEQRTKTSFNIIATASDGDQTRSLKVTGKDPYWLTAVIAAGVAVHLDQERPDRKGAITPSMIAGAEFIRELTNKQGTAWTFSA